MKNEPILVIIGIQNPKVTLHQMIINVSTSLVNCSHCTLWKAVIKCYTNAHFRLLHTSNTVQVDEKGDEESQRAVNDDGFELIEGEDASLPWKCAACEFMDPTKRVVVEHWRQHHCLQVSFITYLCLMDCIIMLQTLVEEPVQPFLVPLHAFPLPFRSSLIFSHLFLVMKEPPKIQSEYGNAVSYPSDNSSLCASKLLGDCKVQTHKQKSY